MSSDPPLDSVFSQLMKNLLLGDISVLFLIECLDQLHIAVMHKVKAVALNMVFDKEVQYFLN